MLRSAQLAAVVLIAATTIVVSPQAASVTMPGTLISGGGMVNATDVFGGYFERAGQFSISAGVTPGGVAFGALSLVGRGDFAAAWGACPYDARCEDFPNTATKTFHLSGQVNSVSVVGSEIVAAGLLTEIDHGKSDGKIFEEFDVQFSVTATEGSQTVVLQFCEIPPFTLDIASGNLTVSASTPQAKLLSRPGPLGARPLACHAPASAAR